VAYENNDKKIESVYSNRVKAGKRRTYFFDVRETRGNDFFLTITESRKRFDSEGYDRHKIFLYKEDFNKFVKGLNEAVDYVKTELMPDFDFDAFNHDTPYEGDESQHGTTIQQEAASVPENSEPAKAEPEITESSKTEEPKAEEVINPDNNHHSEEVDKW
jgi:Protein of unknown function (DUF3276)